jgi:hypothetical protein
MKSFFDVVVCLFLVVVVSFAVIEPCCIRCFSQRIFTEFNVDAHGVVWIGLVGET